MLALTLFGFQEDPSLPPPEGEQQQQEPSDERQNGQDRNDTPAPSPTTVDQSVTVITQPAAEEQTQRTQDEAQSIWQKALNQVLLDPENWPSIATVILAAFAVGFSWKAYTANRDQVTEMKSQTSEMVKQTAIATSPRLAFVGIRHTNFLTAGVDFAEQWANSTDDDVGGAEPVFFADFTNYGPAAALNVELQITVTLDSEVIAHSTQTATIPPNSSRDVFVVVNRLIGNKTYKDINSRRVPLRISGHSRYTAQQREHRETYCMEYLPWEHPRPQGVPLFRPCEEPPEAPIIPLTLFTGSSGIGSGGVSTIPLRED